MNFIPLTSTITYIRYLYISYLTNHPPTKSPFSPLSTHLKKRNIPNQATNVSFVNGTPSVSVPYGTAA